MIQMADQFEVAEFGLINLLYKCNVIILPSVFGSALSATAQSKLSDWVKAVGKVIAIDGSVNLFANKEVFKLKSFDSDEEKKAAEKASQELAKKLQSFNWLVLDTANGFTIPSD
jgi:hypothetical protein